MTTTNNNNNNITRKIKQLIQQQLLITNNITNEGWGSPIAHKQQQTTRIYFQNVNSLRYTEHGCNKWINC